jgi:hypothetical protein
MDNTSGQGKQSVVPSGISGWNWGAFFLNWIWGLGNATFVAFLTFIPFIGFFIPFVLGFKGNEWAWRNKRWDSVDQFKTVQRKWAFWGFALAGALIVFFVLAIGGIFVALKHSDVYKLAMERARANATVVSALGDPISDGWLASGSTKLNGASGTADLTIPIHGPLGKGRLTLKATKTMNEWSFDLLQAKIEGQENTIDLLDIPKTNVTSAIPASEPVEIPVDSPVEKDVSLNISVGGTASVKFAGYFIYRQAGKEVREEIAGKGNKTLVVVGEKIKYVEVQKKSKSGQLWVKIVEDGKVVFKSKKTARRKSIIYKAE